VINGEEDRSRSDYQPSEDDNVLVEGVSGDSDGLGYFGFSYYEANQDKLNLVKVDSGNGCVAPSDKTIQDNSYTPLSRPLFIYPNKVDLKKAEVNAFVKYYLDNYAKLADTAQLVAMTPEQAKKSQDSFQSWPARDGWKQVRDRHRWRRGESPSAPPTAVSARGRFASPSSPRRRCRS
jgi:phosphate transport system substrate-binding protein